MKKKFQKILAGTLAVIMVLTSFAFDFGDATEAKAAEEVYENVLAGDVLADVDFTETNIYDLDDKFVATEGTTDSVYKYWKNGEVGTSAETTNVAQGGTVDMKSMAYLVNTQSWYKEDLLVDGERNPESNGYVSSENHSEDVGPETITVTFPNETYYELSKVCFTTYGTYGIPEDFTISVWDGTQWVTVAKEMGYNTAGDWSKEITPIVANKIQLHVTKLGFAKGNTTRVLQLRELEAYGTMCTNAALNGSVSMNSYPYLVENADWYDEALLVDGNKESTGNTYVSTLEYSTQTNTETITVVFAENTYYDINKVVFSPRNGSLGIPEDFVVQVGNGIDWTTVAEVTGYKTTGNWTSIGFKPVKGNAVRITATKLGATNSNGTKYGLQLRELEAYGWESVNVATGGSATIPSFSKVASWAGTYDPNQRLLNGQKSGKNEFGTSDFYKDGSPYHNESAIITFLNSTFYEIEKIVLYPAVNADGTYGGGFPKDFIVKVWDGTTWKEVASKTDYTSGTSALDLDIEPTMCNAILIEATELDIANDGKTYALHLAEVEAFGEPVQILKTKTSYNSENPTTTLLSLKDVTVENFKAEIELLDFDIDTTAYGLYFGQESYSSVQNSVSITPPSTVEGSYDNLHTLHVEVIDKVIKLWWSGFEDEAWTVELSDEYSGGYISLYSQGADQGGFKRLKVQELIVRKGTSSDFTENDATVLDETFIASQGVTGTNGTVATEGIAQYWNMGGTSTVKRTNVALSGTPSMDNEASYAPADRLNNGETKNLASTNKYESAEVSEGVNATVTFDGDYKIDQITIEWRAATGAPKAFELQVLIGNKWKTVVSEPEYATTTTTWTQNIDAIVCKGFRVHVTTLGTYENAYWLQIKEMEAYGTPVTNASIGGTPNMELMMSSLPASYLNDGDHSTWTSTKYAAETEGKTAIVTFKSGAYYTIDHVRLFPRDVSKCFPVDFTVSVWNGNEWVLATEPVTNCNISESGYWVQEIEPIVCNAIKIEVTKLGSVEDKGTKYGLQLAEIEAWGTQVDFLTNKETYSSGNTTQLTWAKKKVENFKAEIEMLDYTKGTTGYGLYFGQSDYGVVEDGVISVTPNSTNVGGISVGGTAQLDVSTATYVDASISSITYFNKNVSGNQVRSSHDITGYSEGTYDKLHTLNVEVIDGILKVWWTGHEAEAWTIDISEEYQGGYVSLYSSGNDQGGIKNFTVYEILDEDINTNIDMHVEVVGQYTIVTVNNDIAKGILKNSTLKGSLKFDSNKFTYCTTVIQDVSADRHDNVVHTVTNGGVSIDMTSYSANAIAKFYFKNTTDKLDFSGFAFDVESITRTNKETASATTTDAVEYDYTGQDGVKDKLIDARDLVRAAKEDKAPEDVRNALVGIHDDSDWVTGVVGEAKDTVYVDATNGSYTGDGSEESPLNSLLLAAYQVANNGTINVVGDYAFTENENTIGMGGKKITITGQTGNLILTGVSEIEVVGDVVLDDIGVIGITADPSTDDGKNAKLYFYANGHHFIVTENARFTGYIKELYGGNNGERPLETTNMELYGGSYGLIYGGSRSVSTIIESTNLIIGGTVNHDNGFDEMHYSHKYNEFIAVYGGSYNGYVKGDTNVTIQDQAQISMVNGGGYGSSSTVAGTCNVYVKGGETVGYYGGSLGGTVYKTNLVMTGGKTEQIFGGSWIGSHDTWSAGITGSTTVTFIGGTVTRRVYGGCYSEDGKPINIVTGTSTLNVGGDANYARSFGYDYGLCAGSRYSTSSDAEKSVLNITTAKDSLYASKNDYNRSGSSDTVNVVDELP